ncbi:3-deoxy-8-phosphooctulonate synthase [bacterium]|nr:3-deoxy-8-phosphooctulonate synthase [bacterium]
MNQFIYIAGPCVIENEGLTLDIARQLKNVCDRLPVRFVFKASYDKANRTSLSSFRGPGLEEGLRILKSVKEQLGVEVMSDVHDMHDIERAAEVLDVIQIPAFLCRQTDLLVAAAKTGKIINIKKGQFVAPQDMKYTVDKIEGSGNQSIWLTERGSTFGYNNLVVDFRSFDIMREFGHPVIFDATHAVQIPSAGGASSGRREFVAPLARAAAAYGIDGLFTEVYPDPDKARCDGPNSIRLDSVEGLLKSMLRVRDAVN